jgi:hypothetical protein
MGKMMIMKRILKKAGQWFFRVLLVIAALLVLLISGLFIFRDGITRKAVEYVNRQQPGELALERMRFRPFMNFPDVSLQLHRLEYYSVPQAIQDADTLPVMRFNEIFVSMDVMKLMRGQYRVSEVRLDDGVFNYVVSEDTISNLEKALGILFGNAAGDTARSDSTVISFDMRSMQINNLLINYHDAAANSDASVFIHRLGSSFSYFTDSIEAAVDMDLDIHRARSGEISLDRPRNIRFSSSLQYDLNAGEINLQKSILSMRDTELELLGKVLLSDGAFLDLDFRARNQGIELMNFLMSGVLDLDAIEQIGEGDIQLSGQIRGAIDGQLPELKLTFSANDIGFYVQAIDQSVTGISFSGYATNGTNKDLSEALLRLDRFHATFPDGELNAEARIANLKRPEVMIKADGKADLRLLDEVIRTEKLHGLSGSVTMKSAIDGTIDRDSETFLDEAGELTMQLAGAQFSFEENTVRELDGTLFMNGKNSGFRDFSFVLNDNRMHLDARVFNLLPYLYGFRTGAVAEVEFDADTLVLPLLLRDTSMGGTLGAPIRDLRFTMAAEAPYEQLNLFIDDNGIPEFNLVMRDMEVKIPGFAPLSDIKFKLQVNKDIILLDSVQGNVGESSIVLESRLENYAAFLEKDSLERVGISVAFQSPRMRASDLLTINDRFRVLPETYVEEELEDVSFAGKLTTTVGELLDTTGLPDFRFTTDEMRWAFRIYPLTFRDFHIDVEQQDTLIEVRRFEGTIGESNFAVRASLSHLTDTLRPASGTVSISSDVLDINQLLNYELFVEGKQDSTVLGDTAVNAPPRLDQIDYPELTLDVGIGELRYGENTLYGLEGRLRSMPYKVLYLDRFRVQSKTGGTALLDGQFNVSSPDVYLLSANFEIDTLNLRDFEVDFVMEDTVYSLSDNFTGTLDASGMAEVFVNTDLSVDLENTTAMLNFSLRDGSVRNFTPLQEAARFTGNKDLDFVRFGQLRNSNLTLVNRKINIPLMSIESTLGLLLIEGEQHLDGDYLYLVRVPTKLTRQTAWNFLSNPQNREKKNEDEIMKMRAQKFLVLTAYSIGEDSGIKPGDEREEVRGDKK